MPAPRQSRAWRQWVTLHDLQKDGIPVALTPSAWPCTITPSGPSPEDEKRKTFRVEGPYHAGVGDNTRITFTDSTGTLTIYVRGVEDKGLAHRELVLYCEETITPPGED
jgi:hypothetical protein